MNNIESMNAFFSQQEADPSKELTPPDVTFDTQSIRSAATRLRTNSGAGQAMSESGLRRHRFAGSRKSREMSSDVGRRRSMFMPKKSGPRTTHGSNFDISGGSVKGSRSVSRSSHSKSIKKLS